MSDRITTAKIPVEVHPKMWGSETWRTLPGHPLLFKTIDARERLSVQVHPNERTRLVTGGDPKTEMWCLLDDGFVYAGLKAGVGARDVERAVADGSFEELMYRYDLKRGDAIFIPGGLVHAIGDNTRLYEVQQSSDTTFRLYDWGRRDANGQPRELHVEQALKAIDYSLPKPEVVRDVSCEFFDFRRLAAKDFAPLARTAVVHAFRGGFRAGGIEFAEGEDALLAAGEGIDGDGEVLVTQRPGECA